MYNKTQKYKKSATEFSIEEEDKELKLCHNPSGYIMDVSKDIKGAKCIDGIEVGFSNHSHSINFCSTRDIYFFQQESENDNQVKVIVPLSDKYDVMVNPINNKQLKISYDENAQYIDVGAGLGGLVEKLVENNIRKKPKIIEVVDYEILDILLDYGLSDNFPIADKQRLEVLSKRCKKYLDKDKVEIFNKGIEKECQNLKGIADFVTDFKGPGFHCFEEGIKKYLNIIRAEALLLKEGGILINDMVSLYKESAGSYIILYRHKDLNNYTEDILKTLKKE